MKHLVFLFLILSGTQTLATWAEDFEQLKSRPRSYEDPGAICEEIARLDVERDFAHEGYSVVTNIAYGSTEGTLGELDVVIFDKDGSVVQIAEVKCWKDNRQALEKAHDQRTRFLKAARSSKPLFFRSTCSRDVYPSDVFRRVSQFVSIGPKSSLEYGFDKELAYSLRELREFRSDMIRCQNRRECARP